MIVFFVPRGSVPLSSNDRLLLDEEGFRDAARGGGRGVTVRLRWKIPFWSSWGTGSNLGGLVK